jgi:hypothetical protein
LPVITKKDKETQYSSSSIGKLKYSNITYSSNGNNRVDTIEISETAKFYAEKIEQANFQQNSHAISKQNIDSPIFERFNKQFVYEKVKNRKISGEELKKWSAANYVENHKSGFSISGLEFDAFKVAQTENDRIRNYYEREFVREPGTLVNITL